MNHTAVFSKLIKAYNEGVPYIIQQGGTSCFHGDQLIATPNGSVAIKDIKKGDYVYSYDGLVRVLSKVNDLFKYQNHKRTVRIKLKNGSEIICTEDHEFFFNNEWVRIFTILKYHDDSNSKL